MARPPIQTLRPRSKQKLRIVAREDAPPQDLLNHPTTPCSLEACKLAEPQTVQASPLRRKSNGRELRQVVSRFIRSSAATILPSDFEEETEPRGQAQPSSAVRVPLPD